jgi:uncharacterized membrane protein
MTNTSMPPPEPLIPPAGGAAAATGTDLRTWTIICYVLYVLGWFNGLTTIIGVIIAYTKRAEAAGTPWASHYDNLITVFWVSLLVGLIGALTVWFLIGFVILGVLFIWYLYRVIRGLVRALDNRAY